MKLMGILQPSTVTGVGAKGQAAHAPLRGESGGAGRQTDAHTQTALDRLGSFLASGVPPQEDAPRGSYLNITV